MTETTYMIPFLEATNEFLKSPEAWWPSTRTPGNEWAHGIGLGVFRERGGFWIYRANCLNLPARYATTFYDTPEEARAAGIKALLEWLCELLGVSKPEPSPRQLLRVAPINEKRDELDEQLKIRLDS